MKVWFRRIFISFLWKTPQARRDIYIFDEIFRTCGLVIAAPRAKQAPPPTATSTNQEDIVSFTKSFITSSDFNTKRRTTQRLHTDTQPLIPTNTQRSMFFFVLTSSWSTPAADLFPSTATPSASDVASFRRLCSSSSRPHPWIKKKKTEKKKKKIIESNNGTNEGQCIQHFHIMRKSAELVSLNSRRGKGIAQTAALQTVPQFFRDNLPHTCYACIVAHSRSLSKPGFSASISGRAHYFCKH